MRDYLKLEEPLSNSSQIQWVNEGPVKKIGTNKNNGIRKKSLRGGALANSCYGNFLKTPRKLQMILRPRGLPYDKRFMKTRTKLEHISSRKRETCTIIDALWPFNDLEYTKQKQVSTYQYWKSKKFKAAAKICNFCIESSLKSAFEFWTSLLTS